MIKVLFFAKLREDLACSELQLSDTASIKVLADVITAIERLHGTAFAEHLRDENIVTAVNQTVEKSCAPVNDGDEIAFYPPVTGG